MFALTRHVQTALIFLNHKITLRTALPSVLGCELLHNLALSVFFTHTSVFGVAARSAGARVTGGTDGDRGVDIGWGDEFVAGFVGAVARILGGLLKDEKFV
jgi:hypothetical protein